MTSRRRTQGAIRRVANKLGIAVSVALASPLLYAQKSESERLAGVSQPQADVLRLRLDHGLNFASDAAPRAILASARSATRRDDVPQPPPPAPKLPIRPLRLSDWLLAQKPTDSAYVLGLSWRIPEEVPAQKELQIRLLAALSGGEVEAGADVKLTLHRWISALAVTGRVPVTVSDARWLQMNPTRDPIIGPGHTFVLPERPRTVTVVLPTGALCQVDHVVSNEAAAYVEACGVRGGDVAWIAQPDGRVQRYGIALWNRVAQDEPGPGAWIWAPPRDSGFPESFSEGFIRFLATQGPAPDGASAGEGKRIAERTGAERKSPLGAVSPGGSAAGLPNSLSLAPEGAPSPDHQVSRATLAASPGMRSRGPQPTSSDWGGVGLLQTPTARMRETGHFSLHYGRIEPYLHGNVFMQPFEWMEAGFRYTDIGDIPYGGPGSSNPQSTKDKSIDLKLRVWPESAYLPQVAIGLRDIGGTGLFAGEYVVANKRTGDFDWSAGVGWGYVGGRGNIRNPLSRIFGSSFDQRTGFTSLGGELAVDTYFRGPTSVFGGVQYQTPWDSLILKAEYEGNDYRREPFRPLRQGSPINIGAVWRANRWIDLSLGFERGNALMMGFTLHTSLPALSQSKILDPAPVPVVSARPAKLPDWTATTAELERQTYWRVRTVEQSDREVRVVIEDPNAVYWRRRVDRAAGVLHRDAPASVDRFRLTYRQRGIDVAEHTIDRDAWLLDKTQAVPESARREPIIARAPEARAGEVVTSRNRQVFTHGFGLTYSHILGGPDAFVLYQVAAQQRATLNLSESTWLQGAVNLRLIDNYDKYEFRGESQLPRVRTFLREYNVTSAVTVPNLQATHVGKAADNHYYSLYGGYLEQMFGGVGGEWLYRPFASRVAVGVDVNAVRQRDFDQHFGFRDYKVITGHASLYWDTGWNDVLATVNVGRYLAGDYGATVNVSRTFRNGILIGAFATKTNVSAEEFGEGSFDKGVFVSVPFDAVFTRSSRSYMSTLWRPLTRDGGAMLSRSNPLYTLTSTRSDRTLWREPAPLPNEMLKATDQNVEYRSPTPPLEPYTRVTPKSPAVRWERPAPLEAHRVVSSLYAQDFRNLQVRYDPTQRLLVTASNERLRPIGRAAGRAARTALLQAPLEARGIEITLVDGVTPEARYEFFDLDRLRRYFDGDIGIDELRPYVKVHWLNPASVVADPLAKLDDVDPNARPSVLAGLVPTTFSPGRVVNDVIGAGAAATKVDWLRAGAIGAGMVLTSSLLDERAHRVAENRASSRWVKSGVRLGDALPLAGIGIAGLLALDGSDPRRSRTGYAALEAGATAYAASIGLKYVVGRARPNVGLGHKRFDRSRTSEDAFQSFPSGHTMIAWALATPFALEYDMPWLYGVAAATNLARIGSREHWVSDTVASSVLGYGLGRLFWQSGREQAKGEPRVYFDGSLLGMTWDW